MNEDGLVLNGWESTTTNGSQSYIGYRANITATDADNNVRGYLIANGGPSDPNGPARVLTTQTGRIYVGNISSELDGRELTLMDRRGSERPWGTRRRGHWRRLACLLVRTTRDLYAGCAHGAPRVLVQDRLTNCSSRDHSQPDLV